MNAAAAEAAETNAGLGYRPCLACTKPVHHRSSACKACGAPTPWKVDPPANAPDPAPPVQVWSTQQLSDALRARAESLMTDGYDVVDLIRAAERMDQLVQDAAALSGEILIADRLTVAHVGRAKDIAKAQDDQRPDALKALMDPPPADPQGPHVFMARFDTQIGASLCRFPVGFIVDDFVLLGQLRALGAPIHPVVGHKGMACCPECSTIFPIQPPQARKPLTG